MTRHTLTLLWLLGAPLVWAVQTDPNPSPPSNAPSNLPAAAPSPTPSTPSLDELAQCNRRIDLPEGWIHIDHSTLFGGRRKETGIGLYKMEPLEEYARGSELENRAAVHQASGGAIADQPGPKEPGGPKGEKPKDPQVATDELQYPGAHLLKKLVKKISGVVILYPGAKELLEILQEALKGAEEGKTVEEAVKDALEKNPDTAKKIGDQLKDPKSRLRQYVDESKRQAQEELDKATEQKDEREAAKARQKLRALQALENNAGASR